MPDIEIPVHYSDILAGIRHDARIARQEGFKGVADRADALELQLQEAAAANPRCDLIIVLRPWADDDPRR